MRGEARCANANPAALETYLNNGGRAFGSHFHYSFFSGPISSLQAYTAPADWGNNLANWSADQGQDNGPIGGVIDTTLNGSTMPFAKGLALQQWLGLVAALGTDGVPAADACDLPAAVQRGRRSHGQAFAAVDHVGLDGHD